MLVLCTNIQNHCNLFVLERLRSVREGLCLSERSAAQGGSVLWDVVAQLVWQCKDLSRELHSCLEGFGFFFFLILYSGIEH